MMTSFMESAGKSFLSLNLAASYAYAGKKVILVDLDIRKGTLARTLHYPKNQQGVTHYISQKVEDIDRLINPSRDVDNLDFLFSGSIPPNPSEMLSSQRLDQLVSYLKERYDFVFLDSVPMGQVADAQICKRLCDMAIFVLRSGVTDKRILSELEKIYKRMMFRQIGVVLNAVKLKKQHGYYGRGYVQRCKSPWPLSKFMGEACLRWRIRLWRLSCRISMPMSVKGPNLRRCRSGMNCRCSR